MLRGSPPSARRSIDGRTQVLPEPVHTDSSRASEDTFWARHRAALREVVLLLALYGLYELARALVHGDVGLAERRGWAILHWEQHGQLAVEHPLNDGLAHSLPLAVLAGYCYAALHYVVSPLVLIWMYRRHRADYGFARTALVLATLVGLVVFVTVPTAPPRLLPGAGFQDTLARVHQWGWWGGEGSVPRGLGGLSDQVAAMPSLHVGWALWCGVLLARHASWRWLRWVGVAYPVVISLDVMATANHYLLDVLAGGATMVLGALAVPGYARLAAFVRTRLLRRLPAGAQ